MIKKGVTFGQANGLLENTQHALSVPAALSRPNFLPSKAQQCVMAADADGDTLQACIERVLGQIAMASFGYPGICWL